MNTPIFLMGPTASGKSSMALALAHYLPCEIISVDSALIYQSMDIGTAKPTKAEQAQVPHHLIDICDPKDPYNVADFCKDATRIIAAIQSRNKIPLLVGGTMLYFHALKTGLSRLPQVDPALRAQLQTQLATQGLAALYQQLQQVDPVMANALHPQDPQRILRALEVYQATQIPLSEWQQKNQQQSLHTHIRAAAIMPADRHQLHENIAQRFDTMMAQGFLAEAEALFKRGDLSLNLPSMRAVGYRQAWHYLNGESDLVQLRTTTLAATRQLAKRQITWLRKWTDLSWFVPGSVESLLTYLIK